MADVFNLNLSEARDFMLSATGQDWPLQRLIGAGARAAVWLEPPQGASKELIAMAFLGLESGFAAPVLEGGDLQRLRFLRDSGTLSITMRPDDSPLRMSPPAKFVADDLRFSESSLQDIAARAIEAGMVKPASVLKQSAQAPQAAQVTQAAPAIGEPAKNLPWWQSAHDIQKLAQNTGARINAKGDRPSQTAVAKDIASRINAIERSAGRDRHINSDTVRGALTGWKFKPEKA